MTGRAQERGLQPWATAVVLPLPQGARAEPEALGPRRQRIAEVLQAAAERDDAVAQSCFAAALRLLGKAAPPRLGRLGWLRVTALVQATHILLLLPGVWRRG